MFYNFSSPVGFFFFKIWHEIYIYIAECVYYVEQILNIIVITNILQDGLYLLRD